MSTILENWRAGRGLPGVMVIDGHIHFHDWPFGANFDSIESAAQGAITYMDVNGVDACCVLSGGYVGSGCDYRVGNDNLLELIRRVPDRIIGFAHVNPNDSTENIVVELNRVYRAGLRCIKLINSVQQGYAGDGPNLIEVYRFAQEHNMLVLNHEWRNDVILRISEQFPKVNFIMAHYDEGANSVLEERLNVYANIWALSPLGFLERGVKNVGPEKFMLGSDAFMNPMSVGIGLVVYARIPDEHKRMILGLNVARLLDKVGVLPPKLKETWQECICH